MTERTRQPKGSRKSSGNGQAGARTPISFDTPLGILEAIIVLYSRAAPLACVADMLLAFHKPYGVLSQFTPDGSGYRSLQEFGFPKGVYPIGRLDADSEG